MTEIMPSLQNLIKLSYDSPGFSGLSQFFRNYLWPGAAASEPFCRYIHPISR